MRTLEWSKFLKLPGDPRRNWELLCREVVRRHYERFGPLLTRKQQPGVEFHIAFDRSGCELGEAGRHWGWQCKWQGPDTFKKDGSLRTDQRRSIESALEKSVEHVSGLTDWVLWTRDKLTADDARWFDGLDAPLTLHRWDEETLVGLLSGPAEMLLATWFGELILDGTVLTENRREALAPIQHRYVEELHLRTATELETEELLLGRHLEDQLSSLERMLERTGEDMEAVAEEARGQGIGRLHQQTWRALTGLESRLGELQSLLGKGRLPSAEEIEAVTSSSGWVEELEALAERSLGEVDHLRDPTLVIRAAVRTLQAVQGKLAQLAKGLRVPIMVVVGGAGAGKTHLAASLTGPDQEARGVLVLGRQFGAKIADDDLARFSGLCSTRDELLEALDAIGARQERRVPLVIDGLNESDDPSSWQVALPRLRARLAKFSHVFVVVTVRPSYRTLALPPDLPTVELPGLSGLEEAAVARYFAYYKVDAPSDVVHWWRPSDPLLLSIFCRTVNPQRKATVRLAELPASLTEVFEAYLDAVCLRVATTMKVSTEDVAAAILRLAEQCFWAGARDLDRERVAEALGDSSRAKWKESLRFQLEAEEILIREVVNDRERVMWSYDLIAGHVLAKGLLKRFEPTEIAAKKTALALETHPLSEDIVSGLAGALGARGEDLAAIFESHPQLAAKAALAGVRLPASQVGATTVREITRLFSERPEDVLEAISGAALRRGHPLNALLLDSLLTRSEVWQRDLTWTDWMQEHSETLRQVGRLSQEWRTGSDSTDDEAAIAWLSWVLTATNDPLRDSAIQALYRAGKRQPGMLFGRTLQMLGTNDPAVAEGLMAASYGVVMSSQDPSSTATGAVLEFAAALRDRLLGNPASEPTSHWLIREYAYRTAQFAAWISDGEFSAPPNAAQPPLPQPAVDVPAFVAGDEGWRETEDAPWLKQSEEAVKALRAAESDPEKLNRRLQEILGEIRARVVELGWTERRFEKLNTETSEDPFADDAVRRGTRFGEKYASAAFYEAIGRLSDRAELGTSPHWRIPGPPIDPSFPESASPGVKPPNWIDPSIEEKAWILGRETNVPTELIYSPSSPGEVSWVAINGHLWQRSHSTRRSVSYVIRGLLSLDGWSAAARFIAGRGNESDVLPDNPVEYCCFAGEAPWAPTFDSAVTNADGSFEPRVISLGEQMGNEFRIELLGVEFKWDSDRSVLNSAEVGSLPSKSFSRHSGIRKVADRPEFVDPDGRPAAKSVSPRGAGGWSGNILYVREDLLWNYCFERGGEWGWVTWGERQLLQSGDPGLGVTSPPQVGPRFLAMASLYQLQGPSVPGRTMSP